MMNLAALALLAHLAAAPSTQPAAARAPEVAAPAHNLDRLALANGLTALLHRLPGAPMVGVFAVIRAGVVHEREGEDGLSHFLEHLLFNGTDTMTQEQLYAAADGLGAYSNATTRADHTVFQILLPREHLRDALGLHSTMLFRSTLPADKFDKERGIVLEEIAKDAAGSGHAVETAWNRLLWQGTPLARPVIGTPETLRTIGRDAVLAYWQRRYTPANVTVLVVGDVTAAELAPALAAAYGEIPAAPLPPPTATLLPAVAGRSLRTAPAATPKLEIRLGFAGPESVHPDAWALDVLAAFASEAPGIALADDLAQRGFPGLEVHAELERVAGTSAFQVAMSADAGADPEPLVKALLQSLETLPARVRPADLQAIRVKLAVAGAFLAEKPHYFGLEKAALLVNGGAGAVEGQGPAHGNVTASALSGASERWLVGRPLLALASGPGLAAGKVELGGATGTASASASEPVAARMTARLPNGVLLSVGSSPAASVFAVHIVVRDRSAREGRARSGLGEMVHRLMPRRGEAFDRTLADMGATLKTADSAALPFDDYYDVPDYGYVRLETIDAFAEPAIAAITTLLGPLGFADADLEKARKDQLGRIQQEATSSSALSARRLAEGLYARTPALARSVRGLESVVRAVTRSELETFARSYLAPDSLIVTIETGRPAAAVMALASAQLAALPSAPALPAAPAVAAPAPAPMAPLGGPQAYVRMGSTGRVSASERPAAVLAAAILSDRLAADIREKRGMAYSIGAGLTERGTSGPDAWTASAGTRPENAEEVRAAMLAILRGLKERPPEDSETDLAAARLAGRDLMRRLSSVSRAYFAGLDLLHGDEPGQSLALVRGLSEVSPEQVRDAIRRHFDARAATIVVVR